MESFLKEFIAVARKKCEGCTNTECSVYRIIHEGEGGGVERPGAQCTRKNHPRASRKGRSLSRK